MTELAKLKWRCRRGMRELDVLLLRYLEQRYLTTSIAEQQIFQHLLELPDIELYGYFIGHELPDDGNLAAMIHTILQLSNV